MDLLEEYSKEQLEKILEEVSAFHIDLEVDPTQPHLGAKYLQNIIARCRNYMNRVIYYLQHVKRYEKNLRGLVREHELDLEFKINEKLADDPIVRKQSSISDRKAVAISFLREENDKLSKLRIKLLDVEETVKLIRGVLEHLRQTNSDIKLQRQLVRDDKLDLMSGGDGYSVPDARKPSGGLSPPITPKQIPPSDLLDPNARPEDLPEPKNQAHAEMISNFFASNPKTRTESKPEPEVPEVSFTDALSFDDLLE